MENCPYQIKYLSEIDLTYKITYFPPNNQALSPEDYRSVMKTVENAILSTDLAMYFKKRNAFLELVENGEFDWQSEEKKECEFYRKIKHA